MIPAVWLVPVWLVPVTFAADDLEYLTRFAGQLSIAVANSVAFAAERERRLLTDPVA